MRKQLIVILLSVAVGGLTGYSQAKFPTLIRVPADYGSIREALTSASGEVRIEIDAKKGPFFESTMMIDRDLIEGITITSINGRAEIKPLRKGGFLVFHSIGGDLGKPLLLREFGTIIEGLDFVGSNDDWMMVYCDNCTFRYNRFAGTHVLFEGQDIRLSNNFFGKAQDTFSNFREKLSLVLCIDDSTEFRFNTISDRKTTFRKYPYCDWPDSQ